MLRRSEPTYHRTGKLRGYVLKDATLSYAGSRGGARTLKRAGLGVSSNANFVRPRIASMNATEPTKHAFPLLSHTDFGYHDHAANTKWIELANYMPKRNKGLPPWWRGADTYSPLYCEQGRYEYQRYMMISRFPAHYKQHFQVFLSHIRKVHRNERKNDFNGISSKRKNAMGANNGEGAVMAAATAASGHDLPQQALHWILRMIVDNFNPQHIHYLAAMRALMSTNEFDLARDVWRVMERQQTWPDDKLIACYLELCAAAKEKTWAIECWNRYCNEKQFLAHGEADPKPVSRVPFTLNRDELLFLPKWKKHFDHDPNLDVADLNRFNTTRNIYRWMCIAMLSTGEMQMFETLFSKLEAALLSTPTPVPEPPNPQLMKELDRWGEDPNRDVRRHKQWTPDLQTKQHCEIAEMNSRFLSNEQFLVRTVTDCISQFAKSVDANTDNNASTAFCEKLCLRLKTALGPTRYAAADKNSLFATILAVFRLRGQHGGDQLWQLLRSLHEGASNATEQTTPTVVHGACYLEVLRGYADESESLLVNDPRKKQQQQQQLATKSQPVDPKRILAKVTELATQLAESSLQSFEWTSEHHFEMMRILVYCGTMTANKYFVTNVLRKFKWDSDFCELLYLEYRRHSDVDQWAELTKRMLVWTERYNVQLTEECKRLIEEDYDVIKVQVRSFRDVAVFSFRDAAEKKEALDPASQLPNPVMDYVSHALPFPDRDTGYPNEYGDIGQWRDPASGIKGPSLWSPAMHGEAQRGYTAEWRENTATANSVKLAPPWDKKYVEYNRGRHPSYDQMYAGPFPEIFPARYDFRRPTRWDFQNIENQSKYKWAGPW